MPDCKFQADRATKPHIHLEDIMFKRFIHLIFAGAILAAAGAHAQSLAIKTAKATFAGGCFWCMEAPFDKLPGVISTISGYIGGSVKNPTYEQVSTGRTGHTEAVQIEYDPSKVSYEKLVEVFWMNIDPTVKNAQFCDHGSQYRRSLQGRAGKIQALQATHRQRNHQGHAVLSGGGLSPRLLPEEPCALQAVSQWLRA
jgi:peptide-methionine (S)-S-oxide reductase